MSNQSNENKIYDQKCKLLLNEKETRYVGIINHMGRQIAGGYKKTITPLVDEEEHKISLEHTMELLLTKDLDNSLGPIETIITRRRKVTMITIPLSKVSILISAERDSNAEKIAEKALKLFSID